MNPRTPVALLLFFALAIFRCAAADVASMPPTSATAHDWTYPDQWFGIAFNGAKVGFSHVRISALDARSGRFRIDSEASMLLQFPGFEKSVQLRTTDMVDEQLNLVRFDSTYQLDGNALEIHGRVVDSAIELEIVNAGRRTTRSIPLSAAVVPASAILMIPFLHGLEVGRDYRFLSFNSETLTVDEIEQHVAAYEGGDLFDGKAFKIESRLQGQQTTSWLDVQGRPLAELALGGVLVSTLEEESEAKRYLVFAALNNQNVMLDFMSVRTNRRVDNPRQVTRLELILRGAPAAPPSTQGQRCTAVETGWRCSLSTAPGASDPDAAARYLRTSLTVPYDDPKIQSLAQRIAGEETEPRRKIARILDWLQTNIRKHPADAFSALDVLESRRAECQGHAYLYTALARAMGIPTRVINGLVYTDAQQAFLYHSWTESYVDGAWRAVDPTFSQIQADATHIRIAEGEEAADLVALTDWIGRLSIELIGYSHARQESAD